MKKPQVVVIGGGFTGCAIAHDLALRGVGVTLIERGELTSGTSGRTHGHFHSGARYCVVDPEASKECIQENRILAQIAGQCIEYNGGFFVLVDEADRDYAEKFAAGAEACGLWIQKVERQEALKLEPNVNPNVIFAYKTLDGTFDPLRFALVFAATAKKNGAEIRPYHEAKELLLDSGNNVTGVRVWDRNRDVTYDLHADMVINATGAWAGKIAAMAGINVAITPTPGVMVAFDQRLVQRVVQHLAVPGDGDAILPQRRMVVMGTTAYELEDIDYIPVIAEHIREMEEAAQRMVPAVRLAQRRGVFVSARPLIGLDAKGRSNTRGFVCINHKSQEGIDGFVTITGGKATTCRLMAEKTCDVVCQNLGIDASCQTRDYQLVSYRDYYLS